MDGSQCAITSKGLHTSGAEFVDSNRAELIQRVYEVMPIADVLLQRKIIHQETYSRICTAGISQDKMRLLYNSLESGGDKAKSAFYTILKKNCPNLVQSNSEDIFQRAQLKLKSSLERRFKNIFEGIAQRGNPSLLEKIYTELYITQGVSEGLNKEHEVRQMETASRAKTTGDTAISCNNVFMSLPCQDKHIRSVLMTGIAGIGKTVSVQKFIIDWTEGKANKDIQFIFFLPFRDLNLIKDEKMSLLNLVHYFYPETEEINEFKSDAYKTVFIFDGLDESRLSLDFHHNKRISSITVQSNVNELLTNLIQGTLLPCAQILVTSRPAAASQLPPECIDQEIEIRGFKDPQKEEYFKKRFNDHRLANRIISHIKASRSLHIMCHIPIFCWISATVLKSMLHSKIDKETPVTLTEMFTHFLMIQTKNQKYHENETHSKMWSEEISLKLGRLAFEQLEKGHLKFYEEDLRECGIGTSDGLLYSGVCTEIFQTEHLISQKKVYSFVHLSIQEYLAALYVFYKHKKCNINIFNQTLPRTIFKQFRKQTIFALHKSAVDKALESKNGHLDLFLRFLLSMSMGPIQSLLQNLLPQLNTNSESVSETVNYIKEKLRGSLSPERSINLLHCLNELGDKSLVQEIQIYLNSGDLSTRTLLPSHWSALLFVLLSSEEVQYLFDLKKYVRSEEALFRLLPVVKLARTVLLDQCKLTVDACEVLASVLGSNSSNITHLDLSDNGLQDSGVMLLIPTLGSPPCKLETLRLSCCQVTEEGCAGLVSVLCSKYSQLRELELSYNHLGDSGIELLSVGFESPKCKLENVRLRHCSFTDRCCEALASRFSSRSSVLRELDLTDNDLQDCGVKLLCAGLGNQHCNLKILRLSGTRITEVGCAALALALRSNPSHLRELDLSYNHPGDSGVKLLSVVLEDPSCVLDKLNLDHGGYHRIKPGLMKYACQLILDPITAHRNLSLSEKNTKASWNCRKQQYPDHPDRFDFRPQVLCKEGLSGRCYWETEWTGNCVEIGMTYKRIHRKGEGNDCWIGQNEMSWSLYCSQKVCNAWHNKKCTGIVLPPVSRIGVYLDWEAGTLSFYAIFSDKITFLFRFCAVFVEPLYPAFRVSLDSSIFCCPLG